MKQILNTRLQSLLTEVRACQICSSSIPSPNPVLRASTSSSVLVISQAPGTKVHASGVPWDDASGRRLRQWMGISDAEFYDDSLVAIVPMGFCYPGKGKSGDLPPRPECAPQWHSAILDQLPNIRCTLLIGLYSQNYYAPARLSGPVGANTEHAKAKPYKNLTERVRDWKRFVPSHYVLPHPSPRNQMWLRRNPWFELHAVPHLQQTMRSILPRPGEI